MSLSQYLCCGNIQHICIFVGLSILLSKHILNDCFKWLLSNPDEPCGMLCASSSRKTFCSQKRVLPKSRVFIFGGIKREILPSRDSNLALSALLHCNSFRPVFCLTQHIICKWIFKDLHIYITEFLSLKFSKSAQFCPEYVNFLLVPRSWEHSDGEHVCCWLWSQTLKLFFSCVWLPNKCRFLWRGFNSYIFVISPLYSCILV